jgi:hypothetical protein
MATRKRAVIAMPRVHAQLQSKVVTMATRAWVAVYCTAMTVVVVMVRPCATAGVTARLSVPPPPQCVPAMSEFCASAPLASCRKAVASQHGKLPLVPLLDTDATGGPPAWRCFSPTALDDDDTRYNTTNRSTLYCTEDAALRAVLTSCVSPAELVLLEDAAKEQGAVCLDGSPPAVYIRKGDPENWHVHFEGGEWKRKQQYSECDDGSAAQSVPLVPCPVVLWCIQACSIVSVRAGLSQVQNEIAHETPPSHTSSS